MEGSYLVNECRWFGLPSLASSAWRVKYDDGTIFCVRSRFVFLKIASLVTYDKQQATQSASVLKLFLFDVQPGGDDKQKKLS